MNSEELGKRIKEARLAKKMTQSELVGTFITRNMLSRIESGNACPSVKTLEYLAARLELPPGSLIDNADEISPNPLSDTLVSAKHKYLEKHYEQAADLAAQLIGSDFEDEASAILARCNIALARKSVENGDYPAAARYARTAMSYADDGIYKSREISVDAMLMLEECAGKSKV